METIKIPLTVNLEENVDKTKFNMQFANYSGLIKNDEGEEIGFWSLGTSIIVKKNGRQLVLNLTDVLNQMINLID